MFRRSAYLVAILGFVSAGCSSYHQVKSVADLKAGQRVVIGEVQVMDGTMSDWATGTFFSSELVFADRLPRDSDGNVALGAYSGDDLSEGFSDFTKAGGPFSAGVGAGEAYVLGIRTYSTVWVSNITALFPMIVQIPRAIGQCEYLGSIKVWRSGPGQVDFVLEDRFDARGPKLAARIRGCKLVRNLGVPLVGKFRPNLPPLEATAFRAAPQGGGLALISEASGRVDPRLSGWSLEDAGPGRLRYRHEGYSGRLLLSTESIPSATADAAVADAVVQPALQRLAQDWNCQSTSSSASWLQREAQTRDIQCTARKGTSDRLRILSATIRLSQTSALSTWLFVDEAELQMAWPALPALQEHVVLDWPGAMGTVEPSQAASPAVQSVTSPDEPSPSPSPSPSPVSPGEAATRPTP